MDTQSCYMRVSLARASGVKHFKVFDWERAALRIKNINPSIAEAGLLGDWENTGDVIWRGGDPVVDADVYLASIWDTPTLILDGLEEECWRLSSEHPGSGGGKPWPTEALAIIGTDGQPVEKAGAVMSGTHPGAQPELIPEGFGGYCDYCIESHLAPCQDARESLGRNAVRLLVEDYGEEFVKNLLRSHKV